MHCNSKYTKVHTKDSLFQNLYLSFAESKDISASVSLDVKKLNSTNAFVVYLMSSNYDNTMTTPPTKIITTATIATANNSHFIYDNGNDNDSRGFSIKLSNN